MAFALQVQGPGRAALRTVGPKVVLPPLKSVRLLDQLRERIRLLRYSLRTEEAYVYWARPSSVSMLCGTRPTWARRRRRWRWSWRGS